MYADRGAGTNRRGKIESKEGICNTVIPTTKLQKKKGWEQSMQGGKLGV